MGSDASATERPVGAQRTVERELLARLAAALGGPRGSFEVVLPFAVLTVAHSATTNVPVSVAAGVAAALLLLAARVVQGSSTRFVRAGAVAIAVGGTLAVTSGRAEAAFLPGMASSAVGATLLLGSLLVRRPLVGFLIGRVLERRTVWRRDAALLRLSDVLTCVLLVPSLARLAVQYPLYVAGEVAWLGTAKTLLSWPLTAATLAIVTAILVRGRTPLPHDLGGVDGGGAERAPIPRRAGPSALP